MNDDYEGYLDDAEDLAIAAGGIFAAALIAVLVVLFLRWW